MECLASGREATGASERSVRSAGREERQALSKFRGPRQSSSSPAQGCSLWPRPASSKPLLGVGRSPPEEETHLLSEIPIALIATAVDT